VSNDQLIKDLARYIILEHTEDIEFLSVWEMVESQLDDRNPDDDELEAIVRQVDTMIGKAKITVEFNA
jgi:hypothetical protein